MTVRMTQAELLAGFQRLLPRGRVWPREADAIQTALLDTLMPGWARLVARDNQLLVDAFPATAVELLPEWEAALGLPDPCAGPDPTIALRQAQVVARLTATGGQSIPYYTGIAAQLGRPITVTEYAPFRFGRSRFGSRMRGKAWAFAWLATAPAVAAVPFRFGQGRFGERFRTWGNSVLECELSRIAPAHTVLRFAYSGDGTPQPLGQFVLGRDVLSST